MKRFLPLVFMLFSMVQLLRAQQDCASAILICDDSGLDYNPVGIGSVNDFSSPGNQTGCLGGESNAVWYRFQIGDNAPLISSLEFVINPLGGTGEDFDFAVYGPNVECGNLGAPVRCSYAGSACSFCPQTGVGLGATDVSEGAVGDGFVSALTVHPGESFFLLINNYSGSGIGFTVNWGGSAMPYLNCCTISASADAQWDFCQIDTSQMIDLSGEASGAQGTVDFHWTGPGIANPNEPTPLSELPPNFSGSVSFQLLVTDALGCSASDAVTINVFPRPETSFEVLHPVCQQDGEITAFVTNGTPPFTFNWSTGEGSATITGLSDGTYSVSVQDGHGCSVTDSISISGPPTLGFLTVDTIQISCFGFADGGANVQASGGTAPYSFLWSNGQAGAILSEVSAGQHMVTVTDVNGCTAFRVIEVTQPAPLGAAFGVKNVSCFEGSDGEIFLEDAWGGTLPYQYALDSGFFFYDTAFTELKAGKYLVMVEDANGCLWSESYLVDQPPYPLEVDLGTDTTVVLGEETRLEAVVNYGRENIEKVIWSPLLCDDCFEPVFVPLNTETYEVKVIDRQGCEATVTKLVRVNKERKIFVPNAFSPNDDGVNDFLEVFSDGSVERVLFFRVFDRWGGLVYEAFDFLPNQYSFGWNGESRGQQTSSGVYVYVLSAEFIDGYEETVGGDVLLLR